MAIDIKVPALGESVTEASVGRWLKKAGDFVNMDDPLVEIETDKVTLEVNAPAAGTLAEIVAEEGATVNVGAILGHIAEGKAAAAKPAAAPKAVAAPQAAPAPKATRDPLDRAGPAARKLVADKGVDPAAIAATGPAPAAYSVTRICRRLSAGIPEKAATFSRKGRSRSGIGVPGLRARPA